uniref:Uncharacterized protein n=1 Tax=Oryza meridionalis TaxID=40149 RepID=A0A0E0E187_9ORYZ
MASAIASSIFLCLLLLLLPHLGDSYHTSRYTRGSTHFVVRRSDDLPRAPTPPVSCSPIPSVIGDVPIDSEAPVG